MLVFYKDITYWVDQNKSTEGLRAPLVGNNGTYSLRKTSINVTVGN